VVLAGEVLRGQRAEIVAIRRVEKLLRPFLAGFADVEHEPVDAERQADPLGARVRARLANRRAQSGDDRLERAVRYPERIFAGSVGGVATPTHLVGVVAETRRARTADRSMAASLELLGRRRHRRQPAGAHDDPEHADPQTGAIPRAHAAS
jgi:hypothetical protein